MTEKSQEPRVAPKRVKLARPFIKRLRQDPPAEPETWWDTILPGFGATAYPSGRIVYPVRYFPGGGGRGRIVSHQVSDRKSTRLNSSHANNSYSDFCLT